MSKLDEIIGAIVAMNKGNGRINLELRGGKIQSFEPTARIPNTVEEKSA